MVSLANFFRPGQKENYLTLAAIAAAIGLSAFITGSVGKTLPSIIVLLVGILVAVGAFLSFRVRNKY